jgi:Type II intron maturase/Reverse transcriptase (RNA-dependent DNA polymerase)
MSGTTNEDQIKFEQAIQKCWDNKSQKFKNLGIVIFEKKILQIACEKVLKKFRLFTQGEDLIQLLNGIDENKFVTLSVSLLNFSYKFAAFRRTGIINKSTKPPRSFIIQSIWDKVVVHIIYTTLRHVYEKCDYKALVKNNKVEKLKGASKPIFFNVSHGFRPSRSCHTALNNVQTWGSCSWFIDVDILKYFDWIHWNRLINILREYIEDELIFNLIQQMFNAGMLFSGLGEGAGKLQKNSLSYILINVYFHIFDTFVLDKREQIWNKSELNRYFDRLAKMTRGKEGELNNVKFAKQKNKFKKDVKDTIKKKLTKKGIWKYAFSGEKQFMGLKKVSNRIYYVRYINDFLIGIRGSKHLADNCRGQVLQFLKSDMQLDVKCARLVYAKSSKVRYLGFDIDVPDFKHITKLKLKETISFKKFRNRINIRKKTIENIWKVFLDCIVRKKISHKINKIIGGVNSKIKVNKLASSIVGEGFFEKVKIPLNEIFEKYKSNKSLEGVFTEWWVHPKAFFKNHKILDNVLGEITRGEKRVKTSKFLIAVNNENTANMKGEVLNDLKEWRAKDSNVRRIIYGHKQCMRPCFYVPYQDFIEKMIGWGIIRTKISKPCPNLKLLKYHDIRIIECYKSKALGLLEYYRPAINYYWLKKMINYQMRYSLLITLANKHKKSLQQIIKLLGKSASIFIEISESKLKKIVSFLTPAEISIYKRGFSFSKDLFEYYENLKVSLFKLPIPKMLYQECSVVNCDNKDIEIYRVCLLSKKIIGNLAGMGVDLKGKKRYCAKALELVIGRRQMFLCKKHYLDAHFGCLSSTDFKIEVKPIKLLNKSKVEIRRYSSA